MNEPTERKSLSELGGKAAGGPECPHCGCRDFRVVRTWWTKAGEKHSSFVCRHCRQYEFNAKVERVVTLL